MKHAGPGALDQLEPLLAQLRGLGGMVEKKRGVFYRKSQAFLHFHEDPKGLFADLRDFTRLSETRLPYDVVFLLNRYFTVMGAAIEGEGGHVLRLQGVCQLRIAKVEGRFGALLAGHRSSLRERARRGIGDGDRPNEGGPSRFPIGDWENREGQSSLRR